MNNPDEINDFERLHNFVTGIDDIKHLLDSMTALASAVLTGRAGVHIECSVTLYRRGRPATFAGSSDQAILLDGIEQRLGDGPCLAALRRHAPVLLHDVSTEPRWRRFRHELAGEGFGSVLGVPLDLGENASAVLNFFATAPAAFAPETIRDATLFGEVTGRALRLGLRVAAAELRSGDLVAAMNNRSVIDMARGIIMAQNRCTAEEAFGFLLSESSSRNQKLYDVAQDIVSGTTGPQGTGPFEP